MRDEPAQRGRPRDQRLEAAIIHAALEILGTSGLAGLTYVAVAERANTTRPSIYRRYPDITELAVAALASMSDLTARKPTGAHLDDLVAELSSFRDVIIAASGLSLTAVVLGESTDSAIKEAYRTAVVAPRRSRIAHILAAAAADDTINADAATQQVLVTMCTGSWYGYAVAGISPPQDWPERVAELVFAAGQHTPGSRKIDRAARASAFAPRAKRD